jgi:YidC/Oxa1 family membrane protein insertase
MDMEKRFVLAMVLSLLFLVVYRMYFMPAPPPAKAPAATTTPGTTVPQDSSPSQASAAQLNPPGSKAPSSEPVTQVLEKKIHIEDPRYRVTITNHGGVIASWKFLEREGREIELVPQKYPNEAYAPLSLWIQDPQLFKAVNTANYAIQSASLPLEGESTTLHTPAEIKLFYQGPDFRVTKVLHFGAATFTVDVSADVVADGRSVPVHLQVGPGLGLSDEAMGSSPSHTHKVALLNGTAVERVEYKKVEGLQQRGGAIRWAGLDSQYFASMILPSGDGTLPSVQLRPYKWTVDGTEQFLCAVDAPMPPGGTLKVFLGPKARNVLHGVHPSMVEVIDFGWFSVVVEPLLLALTWINSGVKNYGWSIIILTFLITLALFPLRYKQMISMKKMQRLQPQMKAIQERYKKAKKSAEERQKMNVEMMALYKEHGVNPLGGCLPLLLQMPILFAFNSLLASSFELRGAPFILWITDLATKDPYYVTPILMGLTMMVSMKMTPQTSTDPVQNKMMTYFMPAMMMVMFVGFSAGLNLYFLFSNVFSVLLQKLSEHFVPAVKNA